MSRTVIRVVDTAAGGHEFSVEEAPVKVHRTTAPFPLSSTNPTFTSLWNQGALARDAVRGAGQNLLNTLRQHKPVQTALTWSLQQVKGNSAPIFLDLDTPESEAFPWEALCDQDFLALDERWPIARVAARSEGQLLTRYVESRLRITIVISAAAIPEEDEEGEWRALSAALVNAPIHPECQVLVSSERVKDVIAGQAALPSVSVDFLADADALRQNVTAFGPNVVHFFCHGSADQRPELQLATRIDRTTRTEEGSLRADASDLAWLGELDSLLLVTLNCCQGGRTSAAVRALGEDLVERGVPAVIAMRENITPGTARAFSSGLYQKIAGLTQSLVDGAVPPPLLDGSQWAEALCEPRRTLAKANGLTLRAAASNGVEWIVPLLYVHRAAVQILRRALRAGVSDAERGRLRSLLDTYRTFRRQLPLSTTPAQFLADVDQRIAEVESQLYA